MNIFYLFLDNVLILYERITCIPWPDQYFLLLMQQTHMKHMLCDACHKALNLQLSLI